MFLLVKVLYFINFVFKLILRVQMMLGLIRVVQFKRLELSL